MIVTFGLQIEPSWASSLSECAIAVGLSSVLGTLIPPLVHGTLGTTLSKAGAGWIVAGNHTWYASAMVGEMERVLGFGPGAEWTHVAVVFTDLSDDIGKLDIQGCTELAKQVK